MNSKSVSILAPRNNPTCPPMSPEIEGRLDHSIIMQQSQNLTTRLSTTEEKYLKKNAIKNNFNKDYRIIRHK